MEHKQKRALSTGPVVVEGPVDGNAFSVIAAVQAAMRKAGEGEAKIEEFIERAFSSRSYNELLVICQEYAYFKI